MNKRFKVNNVQIFCQYWQALFAQLSSPTWSLAQHRACLDLLVQAYTEPQRAYHQCQHIVECLQQFELVKNHLKDPLAVQLAIFFHDVVYWPRSQSNEQDSATWMSAQLVNALPQSQLDKIATWILATQQHACASDSDLAFLLDIDLAILASDAARFAEYEQQIRHEYSWVDLATYQKKRAQVLHYFYQANPLYQTQFFQQHYEAQAKINLKQALISLNLML
ncbi:metal-dependent hydrolase [Acinetobacter sp. MD2(2019)]|uniref:HD domain-containing protein n=1 Tax=Acinetobacter sp. MD2(2019) TaxID=2605273 RepID=UPI002D1F0BB0|nr:metal-dependent hydrolase [Acinetobacter sp. MD2(2019)]MEB3754092.1 metal-dependent hydrolase [Acinetobacter sp. MD2(2019)]